MRIQGRFRVDICRARSRDRDAASRIDFGAGNVQRAAVKRRVRNSVRGCRFGSTDFDCAGKLNSVVERCRAAFHRQRCSFRAGRCRERAAVLRNSAVESNAVVERNAPAVERDVEPVNTRADAGLRKQHCCTVDDNADRSRGNCAALDADAPAVKVKPAQEFRLSRNCRRAAVLDKNRARLAAQRRGVVKPDLSAVLNDEASVVDEHAFLHEEYPATVNRELGVIVIQRKRMRVDGGADAAGRRFVHIGTHREIDGGNGDQIGFPERSRIFEFHLPRAGVRRITRAPKRVGLKRPARAQIIGLRHVPVGLFPRLNEHAFRAVRRDERNFQRIRKIGIGADFVGQIKRDGDRFQFLREQARCLFVFRFRGRECVGRGAFARRRSNARFRKGN